MLVHREQVLQGTCKRASQVRLGAAAVHGEPTAVLRCFCGNEAQLLLCALYTSLHCGHSHKHDCSIVLSRATGLALN
jgi:hypothetical protein